MNVSVCPTPPKSLWHPWSETEYKDEGKLRRESFTRFFVSNSVDHHKSFGCISLAGTFSKSQGPNFRRVPVIVVDKTRICLCRFQPCFIYSWAQSLRLKFLGLKPAVVGFLFSLRYVYLVVVLSLLSLLFCRASWGCCHRAQPRQSSWQAAHLARECGLEGVHPPEKEARGFWFRHLPQELSTRTAMSPPARTHWRPRQNSQEEPLQSRGRCIVRWKRTSNHPFRLGSVGGGPCLTFFIGVDTFIMFNRIHLFCCYKGFEQNDAIDCLCNIQNPLVLFPSTDSIN